MGCEMGSDYYDEIYEKDKKYNCHYKDSPYYPLLQIALRMVKEIENPQILELGCGTGQFAQMLWDNGFMCYLGLDFSPRAIGIASGLSPQKFDVADIRTFIVKPSDFNTVVMLEVLEHLSDDLGAISRLPKGINIIFSVPNLDDPSHLRRFYSMDKVSERYREVVSIEEIVKLGNYYTVKGTVRGKDNSESI